MKLFASLALLAVLTLTPVHSLTKAVPPPTCNPDDPNCTLDNGCSGRACAV
jgi:hypothetical protein